MKKTRIGVAICSVFMCAMLTFSPAFAAAKFNDVPTGQWYTESVMEMAELGIVKGVGNDMFKPFNDIKCCEFATMLLRQFYPGKETAAAPNEHWSAPIMKASKELGMLEGVATEDNSAITRYDMALIMYNVMKDKNLTMTALEDTSVIADWASIPAEYREAVSVCYNMGMIRGTDDAGTFKGDTFMNRAQAAIVMDRLLDAIKAPAETPSTSSTPITPGTSKTLTASDITITSAPAGHSMSGSTITVLNDDVDSSTRFIFEVDVTGADYLVVDGPTGRVTARLVVDGKLVDKYNTKPGHPVYFDVSSYSKVTVTIDGLVADGGTSTCSVRMGTHATVASSIPAGAVAVTSALPGYKLVDGKDLSNGNFLMKRGMQSCGIYFTNPGYTKATFTVTTYGNLEHIFICDETSWKWSEVAAFEQDMVQTKTYTVSISDLTAMSLFVDTHALISNFYLHN